MPDLVTHPPKNRQLLVVAVNGKEFCCRNVSEFSIRQTVFCESAILLRCSALRIQIEFSRVSSWKYTPDSRARLCVVND